MNSVDLLLKARVRDPGRHGRHAQVWSVSRGVAAPAGLLKEIKEKLIGHLQKILSSNEHQKRADALSLEVSLIAGDEYRKFLKDNEQSTKKLMGW